MSIFDEREIEAGHLRLVSSVSGPIEVLEACTDLIRKSVLAWRAQRDDPEDHADYLAASSQVALRMVNDVGGATKLLDCGYFAQAASLCRSMSEVGMLALLFTEIPAEIRAWRNTPDAERYSKYGRPKLEKLICDQDKFSKFDEYFTLFSQYGAHPSASSIIANHDGKQFHIGPHINEKLFKYTYAKMAILCWLVTAALGDAAASLFSFEAEKHLPQEVERYRRTWELIVLPRNC